MTKCLIALGGNINASEAVFLKAIKRLERPGIVVDALSPMFITRPVGSSAGEEFVNAAAVIDCDLAPEKLLQILHEVEHSFGRERIVHWGPRTLDLDLCLFGNDVIESPAMVVPHPAMWYRRFVLDPAVQVASRMIHPILGHTIEELRALAVARPLKIEVSSSHLSDSDIAVILASSDSNHRVPKDVEILPVSASLPVGSETFARLLIEKKQGRFMGRAQPPNESSRQVRIPDDPPEHIGQHLRNFFAAALG